MRARAEPPEPSAGNQRRVIKYLRCLGGVGAVAVAYAMPWLIALLTVYGPDGPQRWVPAVAAFILGVAMLWAAVMGLAPIVNMLKNVWGRSLPGDAFAVVMAFSLFCTLGYLFWRSFDKVAHLVGQAVFGFGVTVALIVGVVVAYRRRREIRDWVLAHERHLGGVERRAVASETLNHNLAQLRVWYAAGAIKEAVGLGATH